MVALDLATHRVPADWKDQIEGLEIFDSMTGRTMTYLINGATRIDRCEDLLNVAGRRIRVTNATTQARIAASRLRATGDRTGATFAARVKVMRGVVENSARRSEAVSAEAA